MTDHACPCGSTRTILVWQAFANGTRHIREECAACGAFRRFAPQTAENIAATVEPTEVDPPGGLFDAQ